MLRHPGGVGDDAFLTVLAEGLVLSGIAMSISGDSRPSSGACHEISHAFDLLYPQARRAATASRSASAPPSRCTCAVPREESGSSPRCCAGTACRCCPRTSGFTVDEFVQAVEYAPQTRPGRFTILEHLDLSADQIRDAYADYAKSHQ